MLSDFSPNPHFSLLNTAKIQKTCQNAIFLVFYEFAEFFLIFALHK